MQNQILSDITQKWVDLLIPYTTNYHGRFSASELSRRTKIPQQTASRYLNKLSRLNLVNYVKEGRNKLYYLDTKRQTTKQILNLIENQKALQFHLKSKEIAVIIDEILKYSETVIVFGSYASYSFNKESDLDLVILGRQNREEIAKIKQRQTIEINENNLSYSEFAKTIKARNPLSLEIIENHVLSGNISKVVDLFLGEQHE